MRLAAATLVAALAWVPLAAQAQASAAGPQVDCVRLAALRDGAVFREAEYSGRVLAASAEARKALAPALAELRSSERDFRRLSAAKHTLMAVQLSAEAAEILFFELKAMLPAFERSKALVMAYAGTEVATRVVNTPQLASDIGQASDAWEVGSAFGSLVPVLGEYVSAARTLVALVQSVNEASADVASFRAAMRDLEKRLLQAESTVKQSRRRQALALQVKQEIDRRCGRKDAQATTAKKREPPSWLDFSASRAAAPPRTPARQDCGMLDSTESSALAIHEPERFEQLLAECRGRRNAGAVSGGVGGARGTGSSGEVAGRDATGGPGQALPGETPYQQLPTSPQPGFAGGAGGTQTGEPYVFKPFPVEAPRGYSVDPAVGIPRSQPQVPSYEGRNQGTLTCRSGGCAQR